MGGQGHLKVARWSPPLIFPGPGHLKVARWSPQASATRLRTAARLEWLWPAPGLLEMASLIEADVVEPPLPHVAAKTPTSTPSCTASAPRSPNGQPRVVASVIAPFMALLLAMYLLF
ncbi:hypothetical protein V6N13_032855 [Hibiscus sabdariffa]|uniref:Uncharacterized protein n=1 Tax=Hibiscus sabdariffa TaxID=183260 RepID=A0ABR2FBW6_9ROSI